MDFARNVFLFVFATMMLAVVLELWSIAKVLHSINETLRRSQQKEEQPTKESKPPHE